MHIGPDGKLLQDPIELPLDALAGRGGLHLVRSTLSFNADSNLVITIGHKNLKSSSLLFLIDLKNRSIIREITIPFFALSGPNTHSIAKPSMASDKVYVAGQSGRQATIATIGTGSEGIEPELIKIPSLVQVVFLNIDEANSVLNGVAIDRHNQVKHFTVSLSGKEINIGQNLTPSDDLHYLVAFESGASSFEIHDLWVDNGACIE